MKKIFLFCGAIALACTMQAKTLTLDVAHPLSPEEVEYNDNGVWSETYNDEDYLTIDYPGLSFTHIYRGDSWDGYYWDGFTISKSTQKTYATLTDQFNCLAGGGLAGEGTPFLVGYFSMMGGLYNPCQVFFNQPSTPHEVYFCQSAWTYENILNGGSPARAFEQGDHCELVIKGLDENYEVIDEKSVTFYLADFRSENQEEWTMNMNWEKCDLSALGEVYGLDIQFVTTDNGDWGANTASYFALDGLKISYHEVATFENEAGGINLTSAESNWFGADVPQEGWNNWKSGDFNFQTYHTVSQYGAYNAAGAVSNETSSDFASWTDAYRSANGGAYKGDNFAVWYVDTYNVDTVTFEKQVVKGFFVNNNAYAKSSMCNGDASAKKFGDADWFKLTITGLNNKEAGNSVEFYLAKEGKYVADWTYVDLTGLGEIDAVVFSLSSTDNGQWGMNTPAYFCMDNFGAACPAGYNEPALVAFPDDETAISNTNSEVKVQKVIRDGQVLIIRDGKAINVLGVEL